MVGLLGCVRVERRLVRSRAIPEQRAAQLACIRGSAIGKESGV